jgi:2-oxoglutarate dehydrogenase complex dehydrogenase (E1) component-like enzyme
VIAATQFEQFFGRRFIAKKRFGADGLNGSRRARLSYL